MFPGEASNLAQMMPDRGVDVEMLCKMIDHAKLQEMFDLKKPVFDEYLEKFDVSKIPTLLYDFVQEVNHKREINKKYEDLPFLKGMDLDNKKKPSATQGNPSDVKPQPTFKDDGSDYFREFEEFRKEKK